MSLVGGDRRGAPGRRQHRGLAEEVARPEGGDDVVVVRHLGRARLDHEEEVARAALLAQVRARGDVSLGEVRGGFRDVVLGRVGEQRLGCEAGRVDGHGARVPPWHGAAGFGRAHRTPVPSRAAPLFSAEFTCWSPDRHRWSGGRPLRPAPGGVPAEARKCDSDQ